MRLANEISLKLIDEGNTFERPRSEIVLNDAPCGHAVQGAVLEAAIKCDDLTVLFVTDDIPYEEALYIYLFDEHWNMLDSATLGAAYSTGSFKALVLIEPNKVRFRFIGGTDWIIEILSKPRWRMPYFGDPKGVMHTLGFRRHFVVKGNPLPQIEN